MVIENKLWPWKPSLITQYRIRVANEFRLAQRQEHFNELRRQISQIEDEISKIIKQIKPINFTQIDEKLNLCFSRCETKQKRTLKEYDQIRKQLIDLRPKLLIGNSYFRPKFNEFELKIPFKKTRRKRLKFPNEKRWKKGIEDAYRKFQIERDNENLSKQNPIVNISISTEPSPVIINDFPLDEPAIFKENFVEEIKQHEFLPPLPPADEIIIPFYSPPSDQLQLAVDDTIVKPHRLVNKTIGNLSHMSFNIDPEQCSSPKPETKKTKNKILLPQAAPSFSSTAIFDPHAFFTQTNNRTKKQKKKIDISRQPVFMTINETQKKNSRTKKLALYDFHDDEKTNLSKSKGGKFLTDDIITARFAKNSHFQTHQSSMASRKSSKKCQKKNILGIGTSSPLISTTNLTLSPGNLSIDDKNDEDYKIKSSLSKRKTKRTRVK